MSLYELIPVPFPEILTAAVSVFLIVGNKNTKLVQPNLTYMN
jgi:hypothetical protein